MYHRLKSFIEKCNILHNSQYGFGEKRSTDHAVFDIINETETNMDKKFTHVVCSLTCKKPLTQ